MGKNLMENNMSRLITEIGLQIMAKRLALLLQLAWN